MALRIIFRDGVGFQRRARASAARSGGTHREHSPARYCGAGGQSTGFGMPNPVNRSDTTCADGPSVNAFTVTQSFRVLTQPSQWPTEGMPRRPSRPAFNASWERSLPGSAVKMRAVVPTSDAEYPTSCVIHSVGRLGQT